MASAQTPRIGRDELIVVLKQCTTLDLKATFVPGQAGAAVRNLIRDCGEVELTVWPRMGSKCVSVWTELSARRREAPRGRHVGGRGAVNFRSVDTPKPRVTSVRVDPR
ncbi:hypothetical protein MTO96_038852 [Rhipicephalus appendiculatus]